MDCVNLESISFRVYGGTSKSLNFMSVQIEWPEKCPEL